jgi:hypothetical protein
MHWVLIILTFDTNAASTAPVDVAMQEFADEASCVAAGAHTIDFAPLSGRVLRRVSTSALGQKRNSVPR